MVETSPKLLLHCGENGPCHLRWCCPLGLGTIIGIAWSEFKYTHLVMKAAGLHRFVSSCIQA